MKNTVKDTVKDRIVVVGSANMDMVISAADFPQPGETLTGYGFMTNHGGKGANQAVAAARLGANVSFVGVLGGCIWGLGTVFSYIAAGKAGSFYLLCFRTGSAYDCGPLGRFHLEGIQG